MSKQINVFCNKCNALLATIDDSTRNVKLQSNVDAEYTGQVCGRRNEVVLTHTNCTEKTELYL